MFTKLLEKENRLHKAKEYAIKKGGKCLSENYINAATKLSWECSEKHYWSSTYNVVINQTKWCPKCKYSKPDENSKIKKNQKKQFQKVKERAIFLGGKCLSKEYKNQHLKMIFKCSNIDHPTWEATPFSILISKTWCPKCSVDKSKQVDGKIELAHNHAKNKHGLCLSHKYLKADHKLTWKCSNPKHSSWEAKFKNVVYQDQWCPQCSNKKFKTENRVRLIFETYFKKPFLSSRPYWNISPNTNKKLELDGYNKELKIAFEHDGEHHFNQNSYSKNSYNNLSRQKENDAFKKINCNNMGVKLINIPILNYTDRYKFIPLLKHVINCCRKENINMHFKLSEIRQMRQEFKMM